MSSQKVHPPCLQHWSATFWTSRFLRFPSPWATVPWDAHISCIKSLSSVEHIFRLCSLPHSAGAMGLPATWGTQLLISAITATKVARTSRILDVGTSGIIFACCSVRVSTVFLGFLCSLRSRFWLYMCCWIYVGYIAFILWVFICIYIYQGAPFSFSVLRVSIGLSLA